MSDPVSRNSMPGLGIDIGSESVKAALVVEGQPPRELLVELAQGQPLRRVKEIFERLLAEPAEAPPSGRRSPVADSSPVAGPRSFRLAVTGSGAGKLCELLGLEVTDEASALAAAFTRLYPDVRTVVEMGRESQKYLLLTRDERSGRLLVEDSSLGNKCAAGSGSFLDHIYRRLNFPSIEEFAEVAYRTDNPASLSGRCGVFTESDIVHLYQKGTSRERIAAGVHHAISRNYRSCFCRGKEFRPKVAFIGGVSRNKGVVKFLSQELGMNGQLFVPERNLTLGAIGAALRAEAVVDLRWALELVEARLAAPLEYPGAAPLRLGRSVILSPPAQGDLPAEIAQAALGVDIGSVSTKAALVAEVDGQLRVLASYYRRTAGDPLAAVRDTLSNIHQQITDANCRIGAVVAGTTGSGRYLTGDYIGADVIKNEITAQAAGATAFAGQLEAIDSILEIGGQDSKYIALNGEVITDFEMNKACAAGCGAFLEKQAAHLGIPIEEFGQTALQAQRPPDLDWTCTVFSESAMLHYQQNSVPRQELAAGTCLASVKNYLAKTVGGREIGSRVVFQGAVAFNHGMVAAFETVLGRQITVPPYPHLTGAIGVARVALRQMPDQPKFRGFEQIAQGCYTVASFECKSCPNRCDVNTFQIEGGPKYFYNDRCEKYSGVHKRDLGQGLPNLFEERERKLFEVYSKQAPPGAGRVGIPRVGMFNDYFPLFSAFFGELGFQVVPSAATSKRIIDLGLRTAVGEPCFPFKVAHGHLAALLEEGVDFLFVPGIHQIEQPNPKLARSHTCPYWQAAPEVLAAALGLQGKVKVER